MPMVWYIPPLSPVVDALRETGNDAEDAGNLFGALERPADPDRVLGRVVHRRRRRAGQAQPAACWPPCARSCATATWATPPTRPSRRRWDCPRRRCTRSTDCWRSPSTRTATSSPRRTPRPPRTLEETACALDYEGGPGMYQQGPFGEASGRPTPVAVETFHALAQRQQSETFVARRGPGGAGEPAQLGRRGRAAGDARASRRSRMISHDRSRRRPSPGWLLRGCSGIPTSAWPRVCRTCRGQSPSCRDRHRTAAVRVPRLVHRTADPLEVGAPLRRRPSTCGARPART